MGRNVLVVSTVEQPEELLRAHIGEADSVKVVVPVVLAGISRLARERREGVQSR